jgi:hypothetical protein
MGNNQRVGWMGVVVCCVAAGCVGEPEPEAVDVELDEVRTVSGAVDAMRDRARRAFVARDGVLRGGDATAGAEVSADGVALTPYRWSGDVEEPGATLVLETTSITRGRPLLDAAAARPVLTRAGEAELARGGAVEVVRNVDRGIEQAWRFDVEPGATDDPATAAADLVVRVAATGQTYAGRTSAGHHFVDPSTGLGFAYGDATWVDATGARSAVPVAFTGGELVITVPAAIVRTSAYPAVLDPVVSAEYGLDTPIPGPAAGSQFSPDVSYSGVAGAEYLVVWADYRREATFTSDVFAARVNAAGTVLDPAGIHLPTTNLVGHQYDPAVAFGAGQWFIVYAETTFPQIRGMKLLPDGSILSPDFDVSSRDFETVETEPDIAFNPVAGGTTSRFMVTWRTANAGIDCQSHQVSSSGGAGARFSVTADPTAQNPAIAAGGPNDGFVVTWADHAAGNWNVLARQINATMTAASPTQTITTNGGTQWTPAIAFAPGVGYLVVWEDTRAGTSDIFGNVLTTLGNPQPGGNVSLAAAANNQFAPALASGAGTNGRTMLLTWTDSRTDSNGDIFGARVEPLGGSVIAIDDPSGLAISTAVAPQQTSAVAYDPVAARFLAVWRDERNTSFANIVGARVAADTGAVVDPSGLVLGQSFNQQTAPAVAACAGRYLAVWTDTRNGIDAPDIYGALTDTSNPPNVLVANIPISTAAGRQDVPAVACNGTDFFVVWADERQVNVTGRDIWGARVRASDGAVLDPTGRVISATVGTQTDPAITFLFPASTYGVVWADATSGNFDVRLKRISSAGVVDHGSETNVSGALAGDQMRPDIAWDGSPLVPPSRFFVVWQDNRNAFTSWDIFGRFQDVNGTLDPTTITISATLGPQTAPTVITKPQPTTLPSRWLVVAYESAPFFVAQGIHANVISPNGTVQATTTLAATTTDTESAPELALRQGGSLVLTYQRTVGTETFDVDVLGVDVTSTSTTLTPGATFVVSDVSPTTSNHQIREQAPVVACGSVTSCQVLYQRYADATYTGDFTTIDAGGVDRIRGRVLAY